MTAALPPSPSRRNVRRKSPSSVAMRQTSRTASVPGIVDATRWRKSSVLSTALSLKPTMISPKRTPAAPAGPPAVVSTISAPLALRSPIARASGNSSGSELTPSHPFCRADGTLPIRTGSLTICPSGWAGWIGTGLGGGAGSTGCGATGSAGCGETGAITGGCAACQGWRRRHANHVDAGSGAGDDRRRLGWGKRWT